MLDEIVQNSLLDDTFQVEKIRADFPLLMNAGDSLHYLDNAATSQKPNAVIDAISNCYSEHYGPVHRGLYPLAKKPVNVTKMHVLLSLNLLTLLMIS